MADDLGAAQRDGSPTSLAQPGPSGDNSSRQPPSSPSAQPPTSAAQPPPTPSAKPPTHSTPVKHNIATVNRYAFNHVTGKRKGPDLVDYMGTRYHLLNKETFLDCVRGMGPKLPDAAQRKQFIGGDMTKVSNEAQIYPQLTAAIKSVFDAAGASEVRVLSTPHHKAADGHQANIDTVPDAGIYLNSERARAATDLTEEHFENSTQDRATLEERDTGLRSWHWMAAPIEVKYRLEDTAFTFDSADDPDEPEQSKPKKSTKAKRAKSGKKASKTAKGKQRATDDGHSTFAPPTDTGIPTEKPVTFIRGSKAGEQALGQLAEYMLNIFSAQHRTFSYAIYVWRGLVRLLYFDRSGAYVSQCIDWTKTTSLFHDFLWKVAHMSLEQLGYDPTATLADDDECVEFAEAGKTHLSPDVRKMVEQAMPQNVPIYKIRIVRMDAAEDERFPDEKSPAAATDCSDGSSESQSQSDTQKASSPIPTPLPEYEDFLVGAPHFLTDALIGRCTKGFIAYHLRLKRLCFVKDFWRPYVPYRTRPEHTVYERLRRCGAVEGIATLICGGDAGGPRAQKTVVGGSLPPPKPVTRVHYRFATEEIGLPLTEFENFQELAKIFVDAIRAHARAWIRAKVLHRDISIGNIMINALTREGFLIDWDLSRIADELGSGPVEPDRSGTWQFRSALSQLYPRKPYRASDDIESFVHAFRYLVIRFHNTGIESFKEFIRITFETASIREGITIGGDAKLRQFLSEAPPFEVVNNAPLQNLLEDIASGCYQSYALINRSRMEDLYGIERATRIFQNTDKPSRQVLMKDDEDDRLLLSGFPRRVNTSMPTHDDSDPCELQGFLSCHGDLIQVLKDYVRSPDSLRYDKVLDEFYYRTKVLREVKPDPPALLENAYTSTRSKTGTLTAPIEPVNSFEELAARSLETAASPATGSKIRDDWEAAFELQAQGRHSSAAGPSLNTNTRSGKRTRRSDDVDGSEDVGSGAGGSGALALTRRFSKRLLNLRWKRQKTG